MSLNLMSMVRNRLVDDSTLIALLNASTTGSAQSKITPTFMEQTSTYPRIIYSISDGPTDPGMNSKQGSVSFMIEAQASGGSNPFLTIGNIFERISGLFDDQSVSGAGIGSTAINSLLFLGEGGLPVAYNDERKTYQGLKTYSFRFIEG